VVNSPLFVNCFSSFAHAVAAQQKDEQAAAQAYQKANALFQQQQFEQSLAAVEQALKLKPDFAAALTLKARLALAAERYDVAITCLQRAVELEPENATAHFLLGFSRYVENDFKHARPALERALQLQPANARTHFYLALTDEALGRTGEAIAAYEQALKLEKTDRAALADTLVAYARLLFTLGKFAESEKLIDRALMAEAGSRDAQYEKGRLLFERQDYAAAIKHGLRALALPGVGTTERQIHFLLAKAFTKTGQKELAAEHLAKFRAAPPPLRR
jgi:tetratricopeptide (TPR) repeat protein